MIAARTTAKPNATASPKALPPARSFAKKPGVAGRKLVRLGQAGSRVTSASFALPKEFRRPRRSDYFSPGAAPILPHGDSVVVGDFCNARHALSARHRDIRSSAVIESTPATNVIVAPALPLHGPLGRVVNPHALTRFDATSITSTGAPLPPAVQNPLVRTFSVDLTSIRVHTDAGAQRVVRSLSTRAFAYGNNIFLGPGEQPADLRLMAHEVAHVIQQSRSVTLQHFTSAAGNVFEQEAEAASSAAVRGVPFTVRQRTAPQPQGLFGISLPNPLTWLMNRANSIPGFRMLTIILGRNPINGEIVPRSAANILRALVAFVPGGEIIIQALDNYGIFDRVGGWVEEQINSLGMTAGAIRTAVTEFISSLSPFDLLHLGGLLDRAIRIFTTPIDRLISFGRRIATGIVSLIKDAILLPLARLASQTRGWNLLIAVLGRNPITGETVPRTAETLIGGFMRLIGQEEVWTNIQRARTVPRAWAWFQGALEGLIGLVRDIPSRFVSELRQLEVIDIVILPRAFMRIGRVFTGFLGSFVSWAGNQVLGLLQIIFEGVAPRAMPYVQRAGGALSTIFRNPGGFARNLVRAGVQGFRQFKDNFLNHLRRSLIEWLTGAMSGAGLYIPQALNFREILKFALSVLGLTWQNLRTKLVRAIGATAVSVLETTFDLVVTLVREGPAAAWERIRESISNLREMVMEGIMNFVRQRIVVAAITMLASSLVPGAGFIRAIMSIYDTVMFFVERARQIAHTVAAYIDSLAAIASGNISAAANRVETTMARTLTVVISFLASILRLGRVTDAITDVINRIRQPIDRALDRVVEWIVAQARSLLARLRARGNDVDRRTAADKQRDLNTALQESQSLARRPRVTPDMFREQLRRLQTRYRLTTLTLIPERGNTYRVHGEVNPSDDRSVQFQLPDGSSDRPYLIKWHKTPTRLLEAIRLRPAPGEDFISVASTGRVEVAIARTPAEAQAWLNTLTINVPTLQRRLVDLRELAVSGPVRLRRAQDAVRSAEQKLDEIRALTTRRRGAIREQQRKLDRARELVRIIRNELRPLERELPEISRTIAITEETINSIDPQLAAGRNVVFVWRWIGVTRENEIYHGRKVGPARRSPTRSRSHDYREFLQRAEAPFPANAEADHVTELSLGGPDDFDNLWMYSRNIPPNQRISLTTGIAVGQDIPFAGDGPSAPISDAQFLGKYFLIVGFKSAE